MPLSLMPETSKVRAKEPYRRSRRIYSPLSFFWSWLSLCSALMVRMPSFRSREMSSLLNPGSSASRTNLSPRSRMSARKAGRVALELRKNCFWKLSCVAPSDDLLGSQPGLAPDRQRLQNLQS